MKCKCGILERTKVNIYRICGICRVTKKEEFNPVSEHTKLSKKECVELLNLFYNQWEIKYISKEKFIEYGLKILYNNTWLYEEIDNVYTK